MKDYLNLIGTKINSWELIEYIPKENFKNIHHYYTCKCDCGNMRKMLLQSIKKSKSCRKCTSKLRKSIVGQTFGLLKVQKPIFNIDKKNHSYWECLCECGNTKIVRSDSLLSGNTKSCGCLNKNQNPILQYIKNELVDRKSRKILIEKSLDDIWLKNKLIEQNNKCILSNLDINLQDKTASIDRIDSSLNYSKDNIQWVHRDINKMKLDFKQDYFIDLCRCVVNPLNIPNIVIISPKHKNFKGYANITYRWFIRKKIEQI